MLKTVKRTAVEELLEIRVMGRNVEKYPDYVGGENLLSERSTLWRALY